MLMKLESLSSLMKMAVTAGADKALAASCLLSGKITKSEAYRLYGRNNVDRWRAEGLISLNYLSTSISKKTFDRQQLESVAESSNRGTYLPVAER